MGRRIRLTARTYGWSDIVGIVGDVHEVGVDRAAKPMMFVPYHRRCATGDGFVRADER